MQHPFYLGLDVGSTTIKLVLLDHTGALVHARYMRHLSDARSTLAQILSEAVQAAPGARVQAAFSGSGAIALASRLGLPFVQEVIASSASIRRIIPRTDVAIELGGEDAKITFFDASIEQRMNETCAGGTGAFIDQMASYLQTDAAGLNELAKNHKTLYPIASRCGVFAKTDIMPLLNEGAAKEDIAASIFQAVVDQTVSGLACGRTIKGHVALLGGPLHFLSELRKRFIHTLELTPEQTLFPENAQYFVALGAAYELLYPTPGSRIASPLLDLESLARQTQALRGETSGDTACLPALFASPEDLDAFRARHGAHSVPRTALSEYGGKAYLGFDAGSTTLKAVLLDEDGRILFSHYGHNQAAPLATATAVLRALYAALPPEVEIAGSGVTGYGSGLLRAAFGVDLEEVETMAHYKAANLLRPGVSFVLDIGGQDMKCLHAKDGVIDDIMLNEACSAGCGVFVETFARSLGMEVTAFAAEALHAARPVDLGSRCTVFMNSKVKQAQKEGASVGDIAAGLAYSVIRNALYKVIKAPDAESLGPVIVAQGGAFLNDSLLRAFELLLQKEVFRPDISGLMGAYGAAILARDQRRAHPDALSTLITPAALAEFSSTSRSTRCNGCGNRCRLTINRFNDGRRHVSGNRCERGARGIAEKKTRRFAPDLYRHKYRRLFSFYRPLPLEQAPRGVIGLPRALNMYENYPFWHTFFTELGFRVELSAPSSKELYALGLATIPSQTICYPAKMAHGHIMDLIRKGVKRIFFPCVPREVLEFPDANNNFNCPVVSSYPEILRLNIDALHEQGARLFTPFISLHSTHRLASRLHAVLGELAPRKRPRKSEIEAAMRKAWAEMDRFKAHMRYVGEAVVRRVEQTAGLGVVLGGHPYHLDPEIHHGIPDMIVNAGVAVLTEDSVAHLGEVARPLRVLDQWPYHSRLYRAAALVSAHPNLEMVHFNSFGCGLDAVSTDQLQEILKHGNKSYTMLKIDEGSNLGAARIRIRSLLASVRERALMGRVQEARPQEPFNRVPFTTAMRKEYTILVPQLSPIHFQFLETLLGTEGYKVKLLPRTNPETVETGLRHVNNDACYPAIVVVGQLMQALLSGEYDVDRTALMLSQSGGGCRASNYIGFLRKALRDAGLGQVPVISFNLAGLEKNEGFTLTKPFLKRIVRGTLYGDLLSRLYFRIRPYALDKNAPDETLRQCGALCLKDLTNDTRQAFRRNVQAVADAFAAVPCTEQPRPRVALVGEILLKYHPDANNQVADIIEAEGGEVVPTDLTNYLLYCLFDDLYSARWLAGSRLAALKSRISIWWVEQLRNDMRKALARHPRFGGIPTIFELARLASAVIDLGHQTGEGWLLTAEMIEFITHGAPNILCMQPFACLPNHCTGKGVIKELKRLYPQANIAAVDYDPGASEVNQLNRIKLMMAVAHRNMAQQDLRQAG